MSRVSVVMPFADSREFLPGALAQLAALDYPDLEFILVDDASTDGSAALAADFGPARVITMDTRSGPALARDAGIAAATGEWVWFCDADDEWDPDVVTRMVAESDGVDLVCCRATRVEASGREFVVDGCDTSRTLTCAEIPDAVLDGTIRGYLWTKLFRRSTVTGPRTRRRLSSQDDFLLLLDAIARVDRLRLAPITGYRYLERPGSVSSGTDAQLMNTAACAEAAIARLRPSKNTAAGFRTWFYLVPAIATPVHQYWPPAQARRVQRVLRPQLSLRGIVQTWRWGQRSVAIHALAQVVLIPLRLYTPAYRILRLVVAP
ncbi:glycosyltransferase [Corynebacterium sp. TAE3-ERU12]|uniref:glycosyltransferase family 2 protein n=1 Tax=Corynebacterium sp. TAE3-ERU12 TaxID=2849491 RepID=UPI001C46E973|nr:glycosyltransferase [Corynebacterium sp. TAE3-ERU12]